MGKLACGQAIGQNSRPLSAGGRQVAKERGIGKSSGQTHGHASKHAADKHSRGESSVIPPEGGVNKLPV